MSTLLAHKGVRWITIGWTGFIAENVILSHNREWIIDRFGKQKYHGVYNILSSAACLSIAYGYFRYGRNQGPILNTRYWKPNTLSFKLSAFSLQSMGLIGFSQNFPKLQNPIIAQSGSKQLSIQSEIETDSIDININTNDIPSSSSSKDIKKSNKIEFAAQCPIDWKPADIPSDGIYGLKRITRHPMLFSLGFFGLGIAMKTQFATRAILCGFPIIFAVIGGFHQDYRHRRGSGGNLSPEIDDKTSLIPFVALIMRKQSWKDTWNELKHVNMSLGLVTAMYLNASIIL